MSIRHTTLVGPALLQPSSTRNGLRVTVRLYDSVVSQTVHWSARPLDVGTHVADAIPTPDGGALCRVQRTAPGRFSVQPTDSSATPGDLGPGDAWSWSNGAGVQVDLDLVPLIRARRGEDHGGGDIALLTVILALLVGMAQINLLLENTLSINPGALGAEPTPEYIARLLQQDYDGADEGLPERVERQDLDDGARSFYMPSGSEGPMSRTGGGAEVGPEIARAQPEDPDDEADAPAEEAEDAVVDGDIEPIAEDGAPSRELLGEPEDPVDPRDLALAPSPMERFIGWGFRDWYDVKDARDETERQMRRELDVVRQRLRIDPDDPAAITTLGYYAYLAENYDLTEGAFQRMVEMYPDDPSGYNNLALVYKRRGEFEKEEALYRKAMDLDPLDDHVLNNLAVNLAHQGRFDEALQIMDLLEALTPGDPYAELHRAKIYAAQGRSDHAYKALKAALEGATRLDTLHHIEFRQDIRVDPAFASLRSDRRFARLIEEAYGEEGAEHILGEATTPARPRSRWRWPG